MVAPLLAALLAPYPSELGAYLAKPTPEASWSQENSPAPGVTRLSLTSQVWQGITWKHTILIATPKTGKKGKEAILFITGNIGRMDAPIAQAIADASNREVAMLFNIPNQPLWDKSEDALIAHTFGKWMETKDASWPLLFPMTKSAIKAMDAVQEWSQGRIKEFVVAGASKRGWTTWLVGASGDKRVKAISPMVIDILNMPVQLQRQKKMFGGKLSEQIADYSETGLTDLLSSPQGQTLTRMVDPYSYLPRIKVPTLVIIGGNDRYWTVDAHNVYWKDIKGPKLLKIVPNAGHNLGDGREAVASLGFFTRALVGEIPGGLPAIPWVPGQSPASSLTAKDSRSRGAAKWMASASGLDFRDSRWAKNPNLMARDGVNTAEFTEFFFEAGGAKASFSSGVIVREGNKGR